MCFFINFAKIKSFISFSVQKQHEKRGFLNKTIDYKAKKKINENNNKNENKEIIILFVAPDYGNNNRLGRQVLHCRQARYRSIGIWYR